MIVPREDLGDRQVKSVRVNEAQIEALGHLAALMGPGELSAHHDDVLDWVWYRTERQAWCIDEKGQLYGWNDVEDDE